MTKDNQILGSFSMFDIPPGPKGKEEFVLRYDLDSNGILTVTATHKGSGQEQGITLNANSNGRLSTQEIDELVETAKEMKLVDEEEEKRAWASNKIRSLCSKIRVSIQKSAKIGFDDLINKVDECEKWMDTANDIQEKEYRTRYEMLWTDAKNAFSGAVESNRFLLNSVNRMDYMNAKGCFEQGLPLLEAGGKTNLLAAMEWFHRAYMIASEKNQIDKIVAGNYNMGHTGKLLLEIDECDPKRKENCVAIAMRITDAMIIGGMKILKEESKALMVKDMEYVTNEFFEEIGNLAEKDKMYAVSEISQIMRYAKYIKNKNFCQTIAKCYMKIIDLYLEKTTSFIENGDWKAGFHFLSLLRSATEETKLLGFDMEMIRNIERESAKFRNIAEGMQLIMRAETSVNDVEGDQSNILDLALDALDFLSEAKNLTKNLHEATFCKAKLLEAKIFMKIIGNKEKAISCFAEIIKILKEKQSSGKECQLLFSEANHSFDKLEQEMQKEEVPSVNREVHIQNLEDKLTKLADASNKMSDQNFLHFLLSTFPPKHQEN